jgi:hypothetical protein
MPLQSRAKSHASASTKLYVRRSDETSLDEVEKIAI